MASGQEYQEFRETMLSFINRKNGRTGIRGLTSGMKESDAMLLHRLNSLPRGRPLVIQDPATGAINPLPGYDSPVTP